jgi:hypothetical protein
MSTTYPAVAGVVSSDALAAHLQEIIAEYESYKKQIRRTETRETVSIPVEAVALDEGFEPVSDPFYMVTRDMSPSGTGLFHTKLISSKYLRLQFSSPISLEAFGVIARVEHCTPCGKYFIVGCSFVTERQSGE